MLGVITEVMGMVRGAFTLQGQLANEEHHLLLKAWNQAATPQARGENLRPPLTKIEAG